MKDVVTQNTAERITGRSRTYELTITALFIALTYVATAFINVRIPFLAANGGLIHLGNIPLFLAAAIYGKKTGALAGAFGMGLFDLTSGWVSWAPFTFVICGLIGFAYGLIAGNNASKNRLITGVFAAAVIKVIGYYFAEAVLYGNFVVPASSISGNLVQIFVAGFIAVPVILALRAAGLQSHIEG